jgi:uncharacterized membrane protein
MSTRPLRPVLPSSRLEAFSDGVMAVIITIMAFQIVPPAGDAIGDLRDRLSTALAYVLSFAFVGIYWNNHHHLFHAVKHVSGGIMWANLHLLFWLSLLPFTTRWMNTGDLAEVPVLVYGLNLLLAAIAFYILKTTLLRRQGRDGPLALAMGRDWKGKASPVLYLVGMGVSLVHPALGVAVYAVVAAIWLIPDRRVERFVSSGAEAAGESGPGSHPAGPFH